MITMYKQKWTQPVHTSLIYHTEYQAERVYGLKLWPGSGWVIKTWHYDTEYLQNQNDCSGKTVKQWSVIVDHYTLFVSRIMLFYKITEYSPATYSLQPIPSQLRNPILLTPLLLAALSV